MNIESEQTIVVKGLEYCMQVVYDDTMRSPWEEDSTLDGVVTDWTSRKKHSYEKLLCSDRSTHRYFDVRQYVQVAIDQGCTPEHAHAQIEAAFKRLLAWCDDEWHYVGVVVRALNNDDPTESSLWGIESDDEKYLLETAIDLVSDLLT